jgi:O-antigen ligase
MSLPAFSVSPLAALAVLAVAAPSLLAWNVPPSTTFLNQALAVGLWGVFAALAVGAVSLRAAVRAVRPALLALALLGAAAAASALAGGLPASLALAACAMLTVAAVVLLAGSAATPSGCTGLWVGLALASLPSVGIAFVQVYAPHWADGDVIARSSLAGRAVGNLRQPNHLSTLLLCGVIALVALTELGRLRRGLAALALAAAMAAVVLTASRTGMVGAVLLGVWALADRRLTRAGRALMLAAPACYALAWTAMAGWSRLAQQAFVGEARLAESVESSSRLAIWRDTLVLIREHPWWGVGFGEFNFAWTLTPLPQRPVAFFDHTHNLPLQLAVELGVPVATLVLGLLVWALVRAARLAWAPMQPAAQGAGVAVEASVSRRFALAVVAMIGLHSLLEYPLWYAYFLLPAAWCLGVALRPVGPPATAGGAAEGAASGAPPGAATGAALRVAGALCLLGAVAAVADYARVVPIFESGPGAPPLSERVARGQRSVFFAHHAHYAAGTVSPTPGVELASLGYAAHHLLDTRLMIAWARGYAEAGDLDRARHLAARLREFRNPASAEFFEPCRRSAGPRPDAEAVRPAEAAPPRLAALADQPDTLAEPFQCQAPSRALGWRDFTQR